MSSQVTAAEAPSTSLFSSLVDFFVPTAHAEEASEDKDDSEEGKEEPEADDEEEEEEEPEDPAPAIRQDCEQNECKEPAKHFQHCADKIEAGKGWEHEDCVEELFHMMHCVDACSAPKIFRKLA